MGFGIGEYDRARDRVVSAHGELWASRLDSVREFVEYGPTYSRGVWDNVSRAFHALGKPDMESAEFWWSEVLSGVSA